MQYVRLMSKMTLRAMHVMQFRCLELELSFHEENDSLRLGGSNRLPRVWHFRSAEWRSQTSVPVEVSCFDLRPTIQLCQLRLLLCDFEWE